MIADASSELPINIRGRATFVRGYQFGLSHPSVTIDFRVTAVFDRVWIEEIEGHLCEYLIENGHVVEQQPSVTQADPVNWVAAIVRWTYELHRAAQLPVFEPGRIVGVSSDGEALTALVTTFPGAAQATVGLVQWLMRVLNAKSRGGDRGEALKDLPQLFQELIGLRFHSSATQFLGAAYAAGLPISHVIQNIFQFGHGVRGRWVDNSMNDSTSTLAVHLARQKDLTAQLLRKAGIPTPDHLRVGTVEDAVKAAERIGYPVVVKPLDLDRGVAVATFLRTAPEVRSAFCEVMHHSQNVLIEKHVPGDDFRLLVFKRELIAAIRRVPGGVTGDGVSTVRTLLDRLNADPRRSDKPGAVLKKVVMDDEALTVLRRSGRTPETVPDRDEFVRLRYAANMATGATPVDVIGSVHPDNCLLAVRATAALGLDLGGVDLIIPDIGRSWRETGAAICEVNAAPNLGVITTKHVFPLLLRRMVPGNGRIPTVVVLGAPVGSSLVADIARRLTNEGMLVGWSDRTGVTIGQDRAVIGSLRTYDRGQMLVLDRTVEAIVLGIDHLDVRSTGLPFARFDVLVLVGERLDGLDPQDPGAIQRVFEMVRPACDGCVLRSIDGPTFQSEQAIAAEGLDDERLIDDVVTAVMGEDMSRKHSVAAIHPATRDRA